MTITATRLIIRSCRKKIFDELELASLKGEEYTTVNKDQFDTMIIEYDKKMKQWEQSKV